MKELLKTTQADTLDTSASMENRGKGPCRIWSAANIVGGGAEKTLSCLCIAMGKRETVHDGEEGKFVPPEGRRVSDALSKGIRESNA